MNIIAVDDEKLALEGLMHAISKVRPDAKLHGFQSAKDACDFVVEVGCDVAFLDIEMRGESGMELARTLKELNPFLNVIFTTGYGEYASDAFGMHASGYVMKPVTADKIQKELDNLRYPLDDEENKRLKIKAFGNFEAFVDGSPIKFNYSKSKELLAYLVDRNGALCSNQEIMAMLWEDDDGADTHSSYMKNIKADLINTLEKEGCLNVLVRQRGRIGLIPDKISCDYYDYISGKKLGLYRGEYMSQYSWSEITHANLENDL